MFCVAHSSDRGGGRRASQPGKEGHNGQHRRLGSGRRQTHGRSHEHCGARARNGPQDDWHRCVQGRKMTRYLFNVASAS